MKQTLHNTFHIIFWLWNLTFLAIVYAGILPFIGAPLIEATFAGIIPVEFFLTLVALIAVPTICTVIGAWRLSKRPVELMRLFYGVEAPLFALCLIRLFLLRELTPPSTLILGTLVLCIAAFSLELLYGYVERKPVVAGLQLIAHSFMVLIGVYVGLLLLFYVIPAAGALLREFVLMSWVEPLWYSLKYGGFWWVPLFLVMYGFSATLFLAMPSALTALYLHSAYRVLRAFALQYGRNRAVVGAIATMTAWIVVFMALNTQPQLEAFKLLNQSPTTSGDKAILLAKSDVIRQGLINANLSPYRYLSSKQENNHIRAMYESVFGLPEMLSSGLQNSYNQLMAPFLYNGSRQDVEKAEKLYAEFFDIPLQKAERKIVQHALQSTFNRDEVKAGLLNINKELVWLEKQQVSVTEHGDWADIELYEVYKNQTPEQQEIFYYFSLPESAVVTGVWLGTNANRDQRFPFVVSPRGAAQQVYNQEVQRRVDPALLEQVGPRHYRLRAFPIPPELLSWQRTEGQQQEKMHLWLTYKVMRQQQGWVLPHLGEKRNIFWTKQTQRIRNGKVVRLQDEWLEGFLPATGQFQPTLHQANFTNGDRIVAQPLAEQDYSLPQGKRFAVVLDSSYSMATHRQEVSDTFKWLKQHGFADNKLANNDADLYLTDATNTKPQRIDDLRLFQPTGLGSNTNESSLYSHLIKPVVTAIYPIDITFYGSLQLKEMLQQFDQLRGDTPYDGILVVTDQGSYELSDDSKDVPKMPAPLWVVHLGGQLPAAYADAVLEAIQDSGGGVATTIPSLMQQLATREALGSSTVSVADGYAWSLQTATAEATANDGFEPLAARQLVVSLSQAFQNSQGKTLSSLDAIHTIAKTYDIVTPYSSMIVLVNERQEQALKEAEAKSDRFDREVESGNEQLSKPSDPMTVSGVPEPEEWMLLGVMAVALWFIVQRQRRTAT